MTASDGKRYNTDCINQEVIIKTFSENEAPKKDVPNDEFKKMFLAIVFHWDKSTHQYRYGFPIEKGTQVCYFQIFLGNLKKRLNIYKN